MRVINTNLEAWWDYPPHPSVCKAMGMPGVESLLCVGTPDAVIEVLRHEDVVYTYVFSYAEVNHHG